MSNEYGKFVWYELMTSDMTAAEAFYGAVVGWTTQDMSGGKREYLVFQAGESGVGGLMTIPEPAVAAGARPAWTAYISVDDVDAYAKRVSEAGGTVHHGPEDIPDVGRFASVADPQGAHFSLFKPLQEMTRPPAPEGAPGHVGWHELMAGDMESAFAFYSGLFGWTKAEAHDMGEMGVYQLFRTGGEDAVGGMMTKPANIPGHPYWAYYFNVDSAKAGAERVKAAGGQVVNGPMQVPGDLWILQGVDPQGAFFCLLSPNA